MAEHSLKQWESTEVGGLVRHVKSGRYYGRFFIRGTEKWRSLKTDDKAVAKLRYSEKRTENERLRRTVHDASAGTANCGQLLTSYEFSVHDNPDLSASTKGRYQQQITTIRRTWPELLKKSPESVHLEDILRWRNRLRSQGTGFVARGWHRPRHGGASAGTINLMLDVLRRTFDLAVSCGQLGRNPMSAVKVKLRYRPPKPELPDNDELLALCDEIERGSGKRGQECADLCRFLMFSAARISEANALRWRDVDFSANTLRLRGTKTDAADRTIPLIPECVSLLQRMYKRRQRTQLRGAGDENVGPGELIFRVQNARGALKRACKALGLPLLKQHDLRDAFATLAIEAGWDPKLIAWIMGHADAGQLALRVYMHTRMKHARAAAANLRFGPGVSASAIRPAPSSPGNGSSP